MRAGIMYRDEFYMKEALKEARKAYEAGEVPVGAVVVLDGQIIGRGHNWTEAGQLALNHAEVLAIKEASETLGAWRLSEATLYVTLEPCPMCAGALVNARIKTLVFGAWDPKRGCAGSVYNLVQDPAFNHRMEVRGSVLEYECLGLLQDFFKDLRS